VERIIRWFKTIFSVQVKKGKFWNTNWRSDADSEPGSIEKLTGMLENVFLLEFVSRVLCSNCTKIEQDRQCTCNEHWGAFVQPFFWCNKIIVTCFDSVLGWRIRDQLDVTSYYVLFHLFNAQHVSDINTAIIRSLRLHYWITTLVVCSCLDVCWSFGVAGLGWYPCSRLQPATWIPPQPHTIEKSQAPDDGCINVRNMLSIEEVK